MARNASIPVYILSDDPEGPRATRLGALFTGGTFVVYRVVFPPPNPDTPSPSHMTADQFADANNVMWILRQAREMYPTAPVVVIRDSSVTTADADSVADVIDAGMQYDGTWHVLYLCRWQDRCQEHSAPQPITGRATIVVRTRSPQGLQAVVFSPAGRDALLGSAALKDGSHFPPIDAPIETKLTGAIAAGQLDAIAVVPNLFEYDISLAPTTGAYKLAECQVDCRAPSPETSGTRNAGGAMLWWWVAVAVGITLLLIILLRARRRAF